MNILDDNLKPLGSGYLIGLVFFNGFGVKTSYHSFVKQIVTLISSLEADIPLI